MRKFQRAAAVAAAVAGLSMLGAGVGFADDADGPRQGAEVSPQWHFAPVEGAKKATPEGSPKYVLPELDLNRFIDPFVAPSKESIEK
ncbi:hypothetical protein GCM10022403_052500 [Streptomyces coacervatus]|uniref:Secreted protein n=1 Tax=Streptomyces coacervatus TaxID=647381 RepID=A0ABP7I8K6_9ACTN|nr:hypothetical protein [Streptomyces coacervatus]MDF2273338.1 hypothetical protein [Streptomyces coacervatus]